MVYSLPGVEVSSNEPATVKISHRGEEGHHTFHWEFSVKFEVMKKISLHYSKLNHIVNTNIYIHVVEFCFRSLSLVGTPWQSIFKIFEKALKIKTCAKFIMEVMLRRSLVLGIKKTQTKKNFIAPRITSMRILVSFGAISLREGRWRVIIAENFPI